MCYLPSWRFRVQDFSKVLKSMLPFFLDWIVMFLFSEQQKLREFNAWQQLFN